MEEQIQQNLNQPKQPSWRQYALLTVGSESMWELLRHELLTGLLGGIPGALGLWLRRKTYPLLFQHCGRGLIVGRNVTLRGTSRISIGDHVALDDGVVLDARGTEASITLEDRVLISRNTILRSRNGRVFIGAYADIGANCILATDSDLRIGKDTLVAAFSYLIAGGNHRYQDLDTPIREQGFDKRGGIQVGEDVWIGSHVAVQDGASIGDKAVVGSHAMVKGEIPSGSVAWGIPARAQRRRGEQA